ncbi:CCR4-NOT transcription complex subunit 3 [Cryptococcus wingfieldii CBS 7118]|uniref:General negative regulator of transcription subunit n=1 Tax=Cryptococcus wingfieldii CBS 7118 TaxID=1295528 RepID=A0A1E3IS28_9TREE|nr:CCR4-NOT transcription complex subunit 3 [Cryptococcus wingfieldii CBS 7118]ODN91410.1 CCR4-NOT transcription complex subunit 3 [Cryptococcus wingfieldii CBS 7118]
MALRKLQTEIDKTLKAVASGVEVFESTFDKLNHASNTTQKDKLENDLKSQIKKLQRMRDQIKAWLGNGDIKDKTALLENRRLIETQMERFKALEKETKMKAFSKEGLIAQSKLDPAEQAKRDMVDWIGGVTDELSHQIEATEAELEALQQTKKKKKEGERQDELEELNERREWHIGRLEIVQRMLENGGLQVVDVESIEEDVKYFVEANMEDEFDFDNGIYDELNLQEEEDYLHDFGVHEDHEEEDEPEPEPEVEPSPPPKTPAKSTPHRLSKSDKDHEERDEFASPLTKKTPSRKSTVDKEKKEKEKKEEREKKDREREERERERVAEEKHLQAGPTPSKPAPLPPIRYAAAAAAAVGGASASAPSQTTAPLAPESDHVASPQEISSLPPPPPPGLETRSPSQPSVAHYTDSSAPSRAPSLSAASGISATPAQTPGSVAPPPGYPQSAESSHSAQAQLAQAQATAQYQAQQAAQAQAQLQAQQQQQQQAAAAQAAQQAQQAQQQQAGVMGNLMQSFEVAKEICEYECFVCECGWGCVFRYPKGWGAGKGKWKSKKHVHRIEQAGVVPPPPSFMGGDHVQVHGEWMRGGQEAKRRSDDGDELHAALEGSYSNIPQQQDAEPPRYYHPKNPIKTPSHYPQARLPALEDKSIYSRLELDQLFYIFYYMTGTYEQWLAARELKKQSWRFHKQYLTWFQRAHNPQAITSDYEQGGYYYFDWENSWCQRRKSDFRFEYRWLSDH